jgi:hypothetical protein
MLCEKCGKEIQVGEWPFCPHGFPIVGLSVQDDSIPGGETIENLAPTPVTFHSRSEKRRYLKEHGIHEKVRHVGLQGSDKSPHTQRWI